LPEPTPSGENWSREKSGVALLVVGMILLVGFALLLLNAFHSAEAVSLALAVLFVIFGFDLTRKGMSRLGVTDGQPAPPQQPVYYYQPYYGYYQYQAPPATASPYHPGATAPPSPSDQQREQNRGREAIRPEQYSQFR
jgi:hypothetical protein